MVPGGTKMNENTINVCVRYGTYVKPGKSGHLSNFSKPFRINSSLRTKLLMVPCAKVSPLTYYSIQVVVSGMVWYPVPGTW